MIILFIFSFWLGSMASGNLVPQPDIEPTFPALEEWVSTTRLPGKSQSTCNSSLPLLLLLSQSHDRRAGTDTPREMWAEKSTFFLTLESKFGLCIVPKSFSFSISRMLFAGILPHSQEVRYHFSSFFRIMGIPLLYLLLFCFLPFLFSPLETLIGQKWTFLDLFFMLLKPHRQYYVRIVAYVKKS